MAPAENCTVDCISESAKLLLNCWMRTKNCSSSSECETGTWHYGSGTLNQSVILLN